MFVTKDSADLLLPVLEERDFKCKTCRLRRKILITVQNMVNWRSAHLQQTRDDGWEGKPFFYLGENWVNVKLMFINTWQNKEVYKLQIM